MSYVTGISGNLISAASAGYAPTNSADVSAIASAYATGKQDALTFGYDAGDKISSIDGSALAGGGGGGSDPFPYVIQSGTNQRAVLLTAFQDNNANRPTFMVSGYKSSNGKWPRMMVTDYNGSTGYTHSGVLLANAYETYIGTAIADESGVKTFRMDEYSMDFLPFRVWNTSTQSWYTDDLEKSYYHTAKYSRLGVTLSALENSGENALFNQFLNSGIYMSSTAYAYLDTADTASGMSATASASAEINIDSINRWNGKADSSALSSYVPYSVLEYNTASAISGINGSALAAGSTYSAGEGIDITDDVISVETPVDIVAGPGIVIDNPDGNTLRVSTEADAETVLYDAGDSPSQSGPWQISEARTNFEWIDVVFGNDSAGSMKQVTRFSADSSYMKLHLPRYDEEPSYKWSTMTLSWNNTTASIKSNSVGRFTIASNGSVSVSTAAAQAPYLFQIIGVHRISGGN